MKVVILAGGYGTRISEESHLKPKPMLGIGEMPIWIQRIYNMCRLQTIYNKRMVCRLLSSQFGHNL